MTVTPETSIVIAAGIKLENAIPECTTNQPPHVLELIRSINQMLERFDDREQWLAANYLKTARSNLVKLWEWIGCPQIEEH